MKIKVILTVIIYILFVQASTERIALIIGNNRGLSSELPLKYALRDATQMNATLTGIGSFDKDRTYLLLEQSASSITNTFREITGRIKELKKVGKQVLLFIYFSGHGSNGAIHTNGSQLELSQLKELISSFEADLKIILIDACYSGSMLDIKGGILAAPLTVDIDEQLKTTGTVIISSSSKGEQAHESKDLHGSLFTSHFLSGLRGAADFDKNNQVSLWEAFSYANNSTALTGFNQNVQQHPGFSMDISGTKEVYLSNLSNSQASLEFENCQNGVYDIIDEQFLTNYARVKINNDENVKIVVPSGRYVVKYEKQDRILLAFADLTWGGKKMINDHFFKPYQKDIFLKKGATPIFNHHSFFISCQISSSLPDGAFVSPRIGYGYTFFNSGINVFGSYSSNQMIGKYNNVKRSLVTAGLQGNYNFLNKSQLVASAGLQLTYLYLYQEPERFNETQLRVAGYDKLPVSKAHLFGLFIPLSCEINLHSSFFSGFTISTGFDCGRDYSSKIKLYPGVAADLKIGKRFSFK